MLVLDGFYWLYCGVVGYLLFCGFAVFVCLLIVVICLLLFVVCWFAGLIWGVRCPVCGLAWISRGCFDCGSLLVFRLITADFAFCLAGHNCSFILACLLLVSYLVGLCLV